MDTHLQTKTTTSSTALPSAWIDRLFLRLATTYGNRFSDMWAGLRDTDVKENWARELAGYSLEEITRGVESLRRAFPGWPPSLFQFADLCRPSEAQGDPEVVFVAAVRALYQRREGRTGDWPSKSAYWAAVDVGEFDMLGSTWPQIRARWSKALASRSSDANLPSIPEPAKRLVAPEPVRTGSHPELDQLTERMRKVSKGDNLAWARKLIERHEAGDKTVSPIALKMAYDAPRVAAGGRPNA